MADNEKKILGLAKRYKVFLIVMGVVSGGIGGFFGAFAEAFYALEGPSKGTGVSVGAVSGLILGILYGLILGQKKEEGHRRAVIIGLGTRWGMIAGLICTAAVHIVLIMGYGFEGVILIIGGLSGIIVGALTGAQSSLIFSLRYKAGGKATVSD